MARHARRDHPGARHHVMNRFARRDPRISSDAIAAMYLRALAEVPERFGARIHGYALMPNHYHLMLEVPRGNISEVMHHVGGRFTRDYNRALGHDGPLFRSRFKNEVVDSGAYWMHLLAYLHLNPVAARLALRPQDCVWTSHLAYIGATAAPEWLTTDELLDMFGSRDELLHYVDDVRRKRVQAPDGFDPDRFWMPATANPRVRAPRREDVLPAEVAMRQVAEVTATADPTATPTPVRWLTAWWLRRAAALSMADVGRTLRVSPQRAHVLVRKAELRAASDADFAEWVARLETVRWRGTRPAPG